MIRAERGSVRIEEAGVGILEAAALGAVLVEEDIDDGVGADADRAFAVAAAVA